MSAATVWLILGIGFILIEITVISGIGFLFAGLGAVLLGGLITFQFVTVDNIFQQIAYFLAFTALWWGALWKPLKRSKSKDEYKNLVGTYAEVSDEKGIVAGKVGTIRWSGTTVRARIRPEGEAQVLNFGETVYVHGQQDGVFLIDNVKP